MIRLRSFQGFGEKRHALSSLLRLSGLVTRRHPVLRFTAIVLRGDWEIGARGWPCASLASASRPCGQVPRNGLDRTRTLQEGPRWPRDGPECPQDAPRGLHQDAKEAVKLRFTNFALVSVLPESGKAETQCKFLGLPCGAY